MNLEQLDSLDVEPDEVSDDPTDTRAVSWRNQGLTKQAQLEALAPDIIARLLTETIERYVDLGIIAGIREEEKRERVKLIGAAQAAEEYLL